MSEMSDRALDHRARRRWPRLALLALSAAAPAPADEPGAPPPRATAGPDAGGDYRPLRDPLLGFVIEHSEAAGDYRLVAEKPARRVLCSGDLAACEARLLEELRAAHGNGRVNIDFPTTGGKQFWGDRYVLRGWRVQENVFTGHCRLLDPGDVRRAWGSYEACRVALEEKRRELGVARRSDHLVLLVHGLFRSKDSFARLERDLDAAGYEVAAVAYPSTRRSIREHAVQLRDLLSACDGVREVSFVTHSLGGIVVRDLLSIDGEWKGRIRPRRVVMLAPPNRGSVLAEVMHDWLPFQTLAGAAGQDLTPEALARIPPPACEFGIIAGGAGDDRGRNPLLPGDDDGVVDVESTKLKGAADFLVVRSGHTFIMNREETRRAVLCFLERGRFSERREPQPIPPRSRR